MISDTIRRMGNPYSPSTSRLSLYEFVGREEEILKLQALLEEYPKTANLRNIVISGEKSIGKSCLLHRYKQILEDYNFVVYEVELPADASIPIEGFELFKELIDELFDRYAPPDGAFFDQEQSEIWFSLTHDKYEHPSDFQTRQLTFPTKYSNWKRGISETLTYKQLVKDFEKILNELISTETQIEGLAIIIDEFQELSRNTLILDILRLLSEELTGLIVIGAGLPTFLDNRLFEKFTRGAITVHLGNMTRGQILDIIFKPLENQGKFSRHEVRRCFDPDSVQQIVERSGGNPMHVKVLCEKMFDYYQRVPSLEKMELNKSVMEDVMGHYSTISERSKKIRLALESCRRDQLDSFSLLYQYEGFSIKAAILLELAFKPTVPEELASVQKKILHAFEDVWDLKLFELSNETLDLSDMERMSIDSLSHVEYQFIGNAIDKLYASYYYEELVHRPLVHNNNMTFEDILARKLTETLTDFLLTQTIPESLVFVKDPLMNVDSADSHEKRTGRDVVTDLDTLTKTAERDELDDSGKEVLCKISEKHALSFPAYIANILELEGYYFVIADVSIKGKRKLVYSLFPVKANVEDIVDIRQQIVPTFIEPSRLEEYMISINFVYIYWLPKRPLLYITLFNVENEKDELFKAVARRDFESAVSIASDIQTLTLRVKLARRRIARELSATNNYGFCLINVNSLPEAREELEACKDSFLISKVNLAYLSFIQNDYSGAKKILKPIIKKRIGMEVVKFMHLAINHPKLPRENRIAEEVLLYNIAAWNLALITAQEKGQEAAIYSFLKKAILRGPESLIDRRVRSWIHYYRGNVPQAIDAAKKLLRDCAKIEYLYRDVSRDLEIFAG
ncbi:MAG: AAA family ATPase [Deltaproteobacteria bacterium]|nr:AAA family ATPase [Deltaproteobacteria bacterium]